MGRTACHRPEGDYLPRCRPSVTLPPAPTLLSLAHATYHLHLTTLLGLAHSATCTHVTVSWPTLPSQTFTVQSYYVTLLLNSQTARLIFRPLIHLESPPPIGLHLSTIPRTVSLSLSASIYLSFLLPSSSPVFLHPSSSYNLHIPQLYIFLHLRSSSTPLHVSSNDFLPPQLFPPHYKCLSPIASTLSLSIPADTLPCIIHPKLSISFHPITTCIHPLSSLFSNFTNYTHFTLHHLPPHKPSIHPSIHSFHSISNQHSFCSTYSILQFPSLPSSLTHPPGSTSLTLHPQLSLAPLSSL